MEGEEAPPRISCEDIFQLKFQKKGGGVFCSKDFFILCNMQAKGEIFVGLSALRRLFPLKTIFLSLTVFIYEAPPLKLRSLEEKALI